MPPLFVSTVKGGTVMEQRRVTPLTTAGCLPPLCWSLRFSYRYVPIFSFIGYFIMPIPMVIIFMKYGLRKALLLGVTVGFLMGLFIDPVTALVQFLSFGAVGLTLGAGFRYEWSAVRLWEPCGGPGRRLRRHHTLVLCRPGCRSLHPDE